jgi:alkylation response protein AidB-like acyl-CoA dehydrogenase
MIDLDYDDVDAALARSLDGLCQARLDGQRDGALPLPGGWWKELAALGVLGLGTEAGGGTITTVAAAMEALGRADAPGPLVETAIAVQLLDGEQAVSVAAGESIATIATSRPIAWLPVADIVIEIDHEGRAHLATVEGDVSPVSSLAVEPWGDAPLRQAAALGDAERALAVGDVAAAAYMVGECEQMLTAAAEYARERIQFKVAIASFQGVSHPLADCFLRSTAARAVTRIAAHAIDTGAGDAVAKAATARRSATRAALDTAFRVHQTYGAMGFTVEGPIGNRSAKIRQISLAGLRPGAVDRILAERGL